MKHLLFNLLIFIIFINSAQAARVALVIGNGDYPELSKNHLFSALTNPVKDANDMAKALKEYDFTVFSATNANREAMDDVIRQFVNALGKNDVALFYYSGHGVQVSESNYLIPVGKNFANAREVKYHAVNAHWVLEEMESAETAVNIVILDSCRQQMPTESKGFSSKGFGQMGAKGAIISYATALGELAFGDRSRRNSIYTEHLLKAMENGENLPIEQVFKQARASVAVDTDSEQIPWTGNGLIGDFCFGQCGTVSTTKNGDKINIVQPPVTQKPSSSVIPSFPAVISNVVRNLLIMPPTQEWKSIKAHKNKDYDGICFGNCLVFSPNGQFLLSGSQDKTLKLWNISTGKLVQNFKGHTRSVRSVAFSPDGLWALSGGCDNVLALWKVNRGQLIRTFKGHTKCVNSVIFSPDGQRALSGSSDKTLKLWDVNTGSLVRTFTGHTDQVYSVALSPDGLYALSGSHDHTLKLWDVNTGSLVRTFTGHISNMFAVVFSPDGQWALSGSWDKTIKLWDVFTGKVVRTFEGHSSVVKSVAFSPNGRFIASGSDDKTIKLWEVSSGKLIRTSTGHKHWVNSVTFSPNGILASGDGNGVIKLWRSKELRIGNYVLQMKSVYYIIFGVLIVFIVLFIILRKRRTTNI